MPDPVLCRRNASFKSCVKLEEQNVRQNTGFWNIHTRSKINIPNIHAQRAWLCMYVWDIHTYINLRSLRHTYILETYIHAQHITYIHAQLLETYIHTCSGVSDIHIYIHTRSAAWDIHTYMLRRPQTYIHTCLGLSDVHTYMLRVGLELKHTYIHVWRLARPLEVPPLTNLKNWIGDQILNVFREEFDTLRNKQIL